jgi:hypothetical protein
MPRLSASTKRRKLSFPESGKIPTLGQMIRDARGDQQVIRRATQQALRAWFRQSERLNIARREYRLRGPIWSAICARERASHELGLPWLA